MEVCKHWQDGRLLENRFLFRRVACPTVRYLNRNPLREAGRRERVRAK